jgi:hypothetical protein
MDPDLVLVVGAGASRELGLPSGEELKSKIAELLRASYRYALCPANGTNRVYEALKIISSNGDGKPQVREEGSLINALNSIAKGLNAAISIDNYLDAHKNDKDVMICGKLAIVSCILNSEASSELVLSRRGIGKALNHDRVKESWLLPFFQILTENCSKDDLPERLGRVAVICFNYDRCIEQFMHLQLQEYYNTDGHDAAAILRHLRILHPYGVTGMLPWQEGSHVCEFGGSPDAGTLVNLAKKIKTFTEETSLTTGNMRAIRRILASADKIVFLGFGFHRLNLEYLYSKETPEQEQGRGSVFATAYSMSESNRDHVVKELARLSGLRLTAETFRTDLKCKQLIIEYSRSLGLTW